MDNVRPSRGADSSFVLDMDGMDFVKNPYPTYRYLREHAPIYDWQERAALVISRYHEVWEVLCDRNLSVDMNDWEHARPPEAVPELAAYFQIQKTSLQELPEADHRRIRKLAGGAFLPRNVGLLQPMVQDVVDRVLAAHSHGGVINFREIADLVPMQVIIMLLALPPDMEADFHALGKAISASFDLSLTVAQRIVLLGRWPVWMQMLRRLIESRRRRPRSGDLLSYLISVRDQDQALSEDELIALVLQFITAGADTTAHATCRVIYNLLRHPAQFALLQADPSLLRNAIEEILRFDSIIKFSPPRFARHDLEVAGVTVRKGQALYPLLPSALHDPVVFAAPEQLDIRRDPTGSIVYSCGPHNCMGASLARLELEVFIGTTLRSFPQLELAGEPELEVHSILRPMSQLPVRLASA